MSGILLQIILTFSLTFVLLFIEAKVYPFMGKFFELINIFKYIRNQREKAENKRKQYIRDIVDEYLKDIIKDN
jgi:nucleoside recognition membrane protein YjiH